MRLEPASYQARMIILHTIKGNARTLNFTDLTDQLHDAEGIMSSVMKGQVAQNEIETCLHRIVMGLDRLESLAKQRLNWKKGEVNEYRIQKLALIEVQNMGKQVLRDYKSPKLVQLVDRLNHFTSSLAHEVFARFLNNDLR